MRLPPWLDVASLAPNIYELRLIRIEEDSKVRDRLLNKHFLAELKLICLFGYCTVLNSGRGPGCFNSYQQFFRVPKNLIVVETESCLGNLSLLPHLRTKLKNLHSKRGFQFSRFHYIFPL